MIKEWFDYIQDPKSKERKKVPRSRDIAMALIHS